MFNLINIFIICMVTYALSSVWLFSPGLIGIIREKWISFWDTIKYLDWLQYLGICQLCSGFWFGIITCLVLLEGWSIIQIIIISLISAVFSWTFGAITNAALWFKAILEQEYDYNRKYRQ